MCELLRQWLFTTPVDDDHIIRLYNDIDSHKPIILLSGITSGIGGELLRHFTASSAHVIALGHNPRPAFIRKYTMLPVNFESVESTLATANELIAMLGHVHPDRNVILVHCAAVYNPSDTNDSNSVQRTLLINTFLPAVFIESISNVISGVICIGSSSQRISPKLEPSCVLTATQSAYAAYPFSKLLSLVHAMDWGWRSKKPCIVIHPGIVATGLYQNEPGIRGVVLRLIVSVAAWSPEKSALRVLYVLEASRFLEAARYRSRPRNFLETMDFSNAYWDSVSLKASPMPRQVRECFPRGLADHILQITKDSFEQVSQSQSQ
ncbi:unnamed protein product [Agarophyton chilense]